MASSSTSSTRTRRGTTEPAAPLGSLTQKDHQPRSGCASCGGTSVTSLSIKLTDGTPARFASCRSCGHREWQSEDGTLTITDVLARSTKP